MCGIAGFFSSEFPGKRRDMDLLCGSMVDTMFYRGPDGRGVWVDEARGIALGHRRLAILDLSVFGHQPMISLSGRYVIVLNGEIYNFRSIRIELEEKGCVLKSCSDTEVALCAIEQWGFDVALSRFNGMFAFALWDRQEHVLRLARDRIGEKPLYYGKVGKDFVFASELKAFYKHPFFKPEVDRKALALYLQHAYVPAPYSIYNGISKLLPGTVLTIKDCFQNEVLEPTIYWSAQDVVGHGQMNRFQSDEKEAAKQLEVLLKDAVKIRMESDVPLGVFLSGGIDSSLVSALMQEQSTRPIKTFTIGFHEKAYDEAQRAKEIAGYLETEHVDLYVRPQDSLAVIPQLADIYDEPFADSSQIPTYLVSKMTREHVTVALSGDGGDEVFGGYNRYFWGKNIWDNIKWMPLIMRRLGSKALTLVSPGAWDALGNIVPDRFRLKTVGHKIHKIAGILKSDSAHDIYFKLASFWNGSSMVIQKDRMSDPDLFAREALSLDMKDFSEWMMLTDLITYLPDDILVKVDRASMAVGLEARSVFLDHRIVEMAFTLPIDFKIKGYQGKCVLKNILSKHIPKKLFEGPKRGFSIPLDAWLRGPLRDWAEDLLDEKKITQEGFFDPAEIRKKWNEYVSGKRNWQEYIWIILMFQAWKQRWKIIN